MRGGFVLVVLALALPGCSSVSLFKEPSPSRQSSQSSQPSQSILNPDDISSTAIATSKGRADADTKASASCGRAQKTAQYVIAAPSQGNPSVIVYSYACR